MMKMKNIGELSFLGGVVIAILVGLVPTLIDAGTVATVLLILGVLVGLLNIAEKETATFLVAAIALLLPGITNLGDLPVVGGWVAPVLTNVTTFVAPAAVIVALKAVVALAGKK